MASYPPAEPIFDAWSKMFALGAGWSKAYFSIVHTSSEAVRVVSVGVPPSSTARIISAKCASEYAERKNLDKALLKLRHEAQFCIELNLSLRTSKRELENPELGLRFGDILACNVPPDGLELEFAWFREDDPYEVHRTRIGVDHTAPL